MKNFTNFLTVAALCMTAAACNVRVSTGVIPADIPLRPAGQEDVIGMTAPALDTVRVGIVGLGMRGSAAVQRYFYVPWTQVTAVCDYEPDRTASSADWLEKQGRKRPAEYSGEEGYKQLCEREDVDLVYICTDWLHHCPIALYAMEHGKHVAVEVPSATSLEECWAYVNTSERTRRHCVILENCCYDFFELGALELARQGLLGEVLHAEGSYNHCLDPYWAEYWKNWRLDYNSKHKGDVYATHGFGPVCQALNINRGDKLNTLVAVETKSVNGIKHHKEMTGEDMPDFKNGDITCTMLTTENGKSILIEHDVMTPRPYDRMYQLVGTKGYAAKYPVSEYYLAQESLDAIGCDYKASAGHDPLSDEAVSEINSKVVNPIMNDELESLAKTVGGHGGMDFIMDFRLAYCLHYGLPVDMDVYDLATWCCVSELGEISINNHCSPVEVPDFTRGAWAKRDGFKYAFSDGSFR